MNWTTSWWGLTLAMAALSCARLTQAATGPQSFTFTQSGYSEGATVTGAFTGNDDDGNGILVHFPIESGSPPAPPIDVLELTAFSMHFSGNSLAPAFDLSLDDLLGFVFEIDTNGIGDDPAFDPAVGNLMEGVGAIGANYFYTSGLGPNGIIGGHVGGQIDISDFPNLAEYALDTSDFLALVARVPEPSTLWMLVAVLLTQFVRRR